MSYTNVFERSELKFMLTPAKAQQLRARMLAYLQPDDYPDETLNSLYYDTPDFLLIRRSLEKPVYKEKIRLRSYGNINAGDTVYVEVKKKYKGIVYKRRVSEDENTALRWLTGEIQLNKTQIEREISYSVSLYKDLAPQVFIAYDRLSFVGKEDKSLRVTFDRNTRFRTNNLTLSHSSSGDLLLPSGYELLEIKTHLALPMWLTSILSEESVFTTGFSKYGEAYRIITNEKGMIKSVINF